MISASEARNIANEYHQRDEMDIICEQIQNESLRGHYQTTIHGIENVTHARHIRSELNDLGYFAEIKKQICFHIIMMMCITSKYLGFN